MKIVILIVAASLAIVASYAEARIKVTGHGYTMNFAPESIPANFKASYDLMSRKCILCHTMERTVVAVQTGRAPITGQPFDKQAVKAYGIRMLRKPNADMSKQDIRDIVQLLNYLVEENAR